MNGESTGLRRRATRWFLYIAPVVGLGVIVVSALIFLSSTGLSTREKRHFEQTRAALCTLRADLKERARSTEAFLKEHPEGIPGFSAAVIRNSLAGQQRTIKALHGLNCQ